MAARTASAICSGPWRGDAVELRLCGHRDGDHLARLAQAATAGSSVSSGSRAAGDVAASALAAAMNIASVTRRAFTASTPSPTPGKI